MNKEKLYSLLRSFKDDGIICYAYRETVFSILTTGRCDGTLYLITDVAVQTLMDALAKRDFKDITRGGDNVDAKLGQQNVKIKLVDGNAELLSKTVCQPLTICSLMLRDDGDVYDEFGGFDDIENKKLRRTAAPVRDKNVFCTFCFDLTLKRGFVPDDSVREEMKRMVTLPLSKKIQLLLSIRNTMKSAQGNINYILNALSYEGLLTNAGVISRMKADEMGALLRKADGISITLLLCYLAGIKSEQLKSVPNLNFKKETYEKICQLIKDGGTVDARMLKNSFSEAETDAVLFVAEFTTLLAGNDFYAKASGSNLFRSFEQSEFWKRGQHRSQSSPPKESQDIPEQPEEKTDTTEPDILEGLFGGIEDDGYEVEYAEEQVSVPANSAFGLRNPSDNHYIKK